MNLLTTRQLRWLLLAVCVVGGLSLNASAAAGSGGGEHPRISPNLTGMEAWGEHARTARVMLTLFQVAAILAAAKLMGWAAERVRVPGVIGELMAGVLLGPYLLGSLIPVPLGGGHVVPLFPLPHGGEWPVSDTVWAIAVLGERTEKLVDLFRTEWGHRGLLVKFKLEVGIAREELLRVGEASRTASGADYLVANTLEMVEGPQAGAFLLSAAGHEWVPRAALAERMVKLVQAQR